MPHYRVTLAYDGTDFEGFQAQARGRTVQGALEAALSQLVDGEPVRVAGAGRTDAGAHALGQTVCFRLERDLRPAEMVRALNGLLPRDVRAREAALVGPEFHARRSALSKLYRYELDTGPVQLPTRRRYAGHAPCVLEVAGVEAAAALYRGRHDFASLASAGGNVKTTVRTVTRSEARYDGETLVYEVEADGFLRKMVRSMVGGLVAVGSGLVSVEGLREALHARDRRAWPAPAAARGLTLVHIDYGDPGSAPGATIAGVPSMALQDLLEVVPAGSDERALVEAIDWTRLPRHVAVIMDGNGRWATLRRKRRVEGHRAGIDAVRDVVETSARLGLEVLTLYAFSMENWKRPQMEVQTLMGLLKHYLRRELETLLRNNIRFQVIGRMEDLPPDVQKELHRGIERTRASTGLLFNIALNYGGRAEIKDAVQRLLADVVANGQDPASITEESISSYLYTAGQPDPDLLIRTSGEMRISNFLLWQIAYAEIWVTETLWPDFRRKHLLQAIADYQKRERRYGGIGAA